MGAVAAMVVSTEARYAYQHGLFVLAQSGESVVIRNHTVFQLRAW